jgi:hypothetical protein
LPPIESRPNLHLDDLVDEDAERQVVQEKIDISDNEELPSPEQAQKKMI